MTDIDNLNVGNMLPIHEASLAVLREVSLFFISNQ